MKKSFNFLFIFLCCLGFCVSSVFADGPTYAKKKWSPDEDEKLRLGVSQLGENSWKRVSEEFVCARSPRQCRERWKNYLSTNTDKNIQWNVRSDKRLLYLYKKYGPNWARIASLMPGRSDISVKNRYQILITRLHHSLEKEDRYWFRREGTSRRYRRALFRSVTDLMKSEEKASYVQKYDGDKTVIPEVPMSISCDPLPLCF